MKKDDTKTGKLQFILNQISGVFLPVINIITAASILKSVLLLLAASSVLSKESGLYLVLYAIADGFFYFLPFFLAVTASKQWKTDPFIAMMIPAAVLYPAITEVFESGESISFLFLKIPSTMYQSSVIPVLLSVLFLKLVEKPFDKFLPEAIKGFLKPLLCSLVVIPATFLVFGPAGTLIGKFLTGVFFKIYGWSPIAAGAFLGFIIQPMVMTGAHFCIVPVCLLSITEKGYDVILPLLGGAVMAQAGAAFAMFLIFREKNLPEKRRVALQASFTAFLGVSEPALYGVNGPILRVMLAACTAGAIGGAMTGAAGTHCTSFAFPSFLTCTAYVGPGFLVFLCSMVTGLFFGFLFTILQKKQIKKLV